MSRHLHDPACYDLAKYFLPNTCSERLKSEFAQHIQESVEDWIMTERARIVAEGGEL